MSIEGARMTTSTAEKNATETHPSGEYTSQPVIPSEEPRLTRGSWIVMVVVAAIVAGVVVFGVLARRGSEHSLAKETAASAIPSVNIVYPTPSTLSPEIALPGNTQAFMDTPIYSRTNGYLRNWYFDIGAHVRKGQLMAQIETPEVDQQLQVAQADLKSAQANLDLANTTSGRYQNLLKTNSVSKQETDVAMSDAAAKKAAVDASMANVRRLEQLQSFEKVYAPFDGIVTARNTDIGALIDAGATTQPRELIHMAAIRKLRLYVAVPEVYSRAARSGAPATLTLDEFPGQTFHGTLVRNANSIDIASRTLLVEVDVDNPTGQLLPGAYVFVHLKLPDETHSVSIPSNTLIFRKEGLQIGLVRNGKAELVPVKISRDYGNSVEIVSGLQPTDAVIVDPSDSLVAGMPVRLRSKPTGGAGR